MKFKETEPGRPWRSQVTKTQQVALAHLGLVTSSLGRACGLVLRSCSLSSSMGQLLPLTLNGCVAQGRGGLRASKAKLFRQGSPSQPVLQVKLVMMAG